MAAKKSAGILLYRRRGGALEVLLAHPGGPFWKKRDLGSWTIPKGEVDEGEDALAAALREFTEETAIVPPEAPALELTPLRQPSRKLIHAWAIEGDCDAAGCSSNLFRMEWPPKSGQFADFPEIDRVEWFDLATASRKILPGQAPFLAELAALLEAR
jgi:predicted NUDIX family NTP pyrophosphohydrolase